ncbi:hypothetical protein [Nocardia transvalensis]|uniref:hypothetical protein n=1 Tax=Nocardia transvalensis TaxID=37333 RepID=UPI0018946E78|nr:hypothetical protein [Nocardia transvalensis]MBF6333185.1 hypothetical protein [Nocardia transvalensis]
MMRRVLMLLIVTALSTLTLASAGTAGADPAPGPVAPSGSLPNGFPADLRKFVGNTPEFKTAWFTGPCKDRGGDIGAYTNAALANEDRLIYWSMTDEQKKVFVVGAAGAQGRHSLGPHLEAGVEAGREPSKELLPRVFPSGDPAYALPQPACADDLKRWASPQWNTWGFVWSAVPDKQSLTEMRKTSGAGEVPDKAWTAPCGGGVPGIYCAHAFFVNCDQADAPSGDQRNCVAWNTQVARLFAGTANWIDQNKSLNDRIDETLRDAGVYAAGNAIVSAFTWVFGTAIPTAIKFVADPQSVIDDWANATKASAVDLSSKVLRGLVAVGAFDPSQGWFLRWYALSTGIGIAVMGLMTLLALWRAAAKGETAKTIAADLFGYLPAGVILMLFAPFLAQLIVGAANAMSESIVHISGPDMGEMVTNLEHFSGKLTAPALPGGVVVGLILFLLLIAGSLAVFFGLLMHAVALPALAIASGIGFGMWVHPKWRTKALRPVLLFIGLVASKPLLFLLLALETSVVNAALTGQPAGQGTLGTLGQLCLVVVAFIVVGLAPWSLLRYAPLLPSRSDANGFGGHSSSLLAGAVGGLGANALSRRRSRHDSSTPNSDASKGQKDQRGGNDDGDPSWRTADRDDGRSPTEAHLGATMGSRRNEATSNTKTGDRDRSSGIGRKLASGLGSGVSKGAAIVATAGAVAVPVAAAGAAAALEKGRAAAEAAPGEAEE